MSLFASAALAQGAASQPQGSTPAAGAASAAISEADMKMIRMCRNMSDGMRNGSQTCRRLSKEHPDMMDRSKPLAQQQASADTNSPPPKPATKKGS